MRNITNILWIDSDTVAGAVGTRRRRPSALVSALAGIVIFTVSTSAILTPRAIAEPARAHVERRTWVMGTRLVVAVEADKRSTALEASEAALDAVAAVESRLSTWRDDSELSKLNGAAPGTGVALSRELEADLREARYWWSATDGAFDPGIAPLVEIWDLRGSGRVPSDAELDVTRTASGLEFLVLEPGVARLAKAGFGIEEGGFGKGIALRSAVAAARDAGAGCVVLDFGGQISMNGSCGAAWVEIAHPDDRHRGLARLEMGVGSIATSGNSERGLNVDGARHGHILDPRSGRPAVDWGTVTVVTEDPVTADCVSTALLVMGPKQGVDWLRGRPDIDAVFVERSGDTTEMTATAGLVGRLETFGGKVEFLPPPRSVMTENSG